MKRLGYEQFVAAGGDYGALVVEYMAGGRDAPVSAEPAPPELLGYHTNFPGVFPPDIDAAIRTGGEQPSDLSAEEQRAIEQLGSEYKHAAYAVQLGTRPQTMYALNDSPIGLAAFLLDHDPKSYQLIARGFVDGVEGGLTRDDFLDNITMFWLTNTGVSSSKAFWEYLGYGSFANVRNVTVPVAVSVFPDELYQAPRELDGEGVPQPRALQRGRPGRALRRLGAAGAVRLRAARRTPVAALARTCQRHTHVVMVRDDDHADHTTLTKEDHNGSHDRSAGGRHNDPAVHVRGPRGGPRGPAGAHRGHALARQGDRRRSCRRARSSRRCRHSLAIGRPSTTGARSRRG